MNTELLLYKYAQLRGAKPRKDLVAGVEMHSMTVVGKGPQAPREDRHVVLLHGIGSCGAHWLQVMFQIAALGYTVHAPDLPGHGLSSEFPGTLTSTALFETVVEWMEKVAPRKFILVGNSLGGALSWRFSAREPERVEKVVLLSPAVGFSSEEIWTEFARSLAVPTFGAALRFLDRLMKGTFFVSPIMAPPIYRNMNRRAVRDLLETTHFSEFALQHRIGEVTVPTLLIWGKRDNLLPKSNLDWIKTAMRKEVELLEPEGVGHCPQLCSPRWLMNVLRRSVLSTETASPGRSHRAAGHSAP